MQDTALALRAKIETAPPYSQDADRWQAVVTRDKRADGFFFYAVESTGVYCRPGCGARRPNRENVRFHESSVGAEKAGYRPCQRCRPNESSRQAALVAEACRLLSQSETPPSLTILAEHAGLSPFHFHRVFKAATGVTPKAYADAARARRVRDALNDATTVTAALYDAGYGSSGRFYEASAGILGMTPTRFRAGGRGETLRFATGSCALGAVLVAATNQGVAAIDLGDDPRQLVDSLKERFPNARLIEGDGAFQNHVDAIVAFIDQPGQTLDLPLDIRGTAFQQRVWQALRAIPLGQTATYADIAARIGAPAASRAVARACATNPLAVAIPCHRVVRTDETLSGYRWGAARKRALLDRERL